MSEKRPSKRWNRHLLICFVALFLLALVDQSCIPELDQKETIYGILQDSTGKPLPGLPLIIEGSKTSGWFPSVTQIIAQYNIRADQQGRFSQEVRWHNGISEFNIYTTGCYSILGCNFINPSSLKPQLGHCSIGTSRTLYSPYDVQLTAVYQCR
jgi:hypothetical protein